MKQSMRFALSLLALTLGLVAGSSGQRLRAQASSNGGKNVDVYYITELLDGMLKKTRQQAALVQNVRANELSRLTGAIELAQSSSDKAALEQAVQFAEESGMEAGNAENELQNFYYTLKAALGGRGSAPSCELLTCAEHATCTMRSGYAECVCETGYQGDVSRCEPITFFPPRPMFPSLDVKQAHTMLDVDVAVYLHNFLLVSFRDGKSGDRGFFVPGYATIADVQWGKAQAFSGKLAAFEPVVTSMTTGKFVVSFRDAKAHGTGYLVAGSFPAGLDTPHGQHTCGSCHSGCVIQGRCFKKDPSTGLAATADTCSKAAGANTWCPESFLPLTFGDAVPFARQQSEKVALVALVSSRVACLYAGQLVTVTGEVTQSFGGAALVQLADAGKLHILGKYRFAELPVKEIAATAMTASSFVIAFSQKDHSAAPGSPSLELSTVWAQMDGAELGISAQTLTLDTGKTGMTGRDVAVVSQNIFAYSYQYANLKQMKVATIYVDPTTHVMSVVGAPKIVSEGGSSPFVKAISAASGSATPHLFTYFQNPGQGSSAKGCLVSRAGQIGMCETWQWSGGVAVSTVSAKKLWDGRLFFVYAGSDGTPFWQFVGVETAEVHH